MSRAASRPLLVRSDRWRTRFEDQLAVLPAEPTAEQWHQLRDSLGRLAAWLRMAGQRPLRDRVKTLRRAIGEIRDIDIARGRLDSSASAALFSRLGSERDRKAATLVHRLAAPSTGKLLRDLQETPPLNYEAAVDASRRMARRAWKAGRRFVNEPAPATAHRLRRRLRELRFAREWLRQETAPLRPLVRRLGRLNDRLLVWEVLPQSGDQGKAAHKIERSLEHCRAQWRSLRSQIKEWAL